MGMKCAVSNPVKIKNKSYQSWKEYNSQQPENERQYYNKIMVKTMGNHSTILTKNNVDIAQFTDKGNCGERERDYGEKL